MVSRESGVGDSREGCFRQMMRANFIVLFVLRAMVAVSLSVVAVIALAAVIS
jgi:hypothetical protein